jgi:hypothetical protein
MRSDLQGPVKRDDPEYWDRLALRVAATAHIPRRGAFDWIADSRVAWVTTFLVAAAALTALIRPVRETQQLTRGQWAEMVVPSDSLGQAVIGRDRPPRIEALLLSASGELVR